MTSTRSRERIVLLDKAHVWHPYTQMSDYVERVQPLVIDRASGARLYDRDGRSYIDGNSSWWACVLGHGHPRIVRALCEQAGALCHTSLAGITHEAAALLAAELVAVAPDGLTRVFFSDDGSTAVEAAAKMALQYFYQNGRPERRRFVTLDAAFHGETLGAAALGGVEVFRKPFAGVLMDCVHVPRGEEGFARAFDALAELVAAESRSIAAVVLEPVVQGAAGMRTYDPELLAVARRVTEQYDVFLIVDEVFTGYGRTGPMWACQHAGITPDLLCTAKGFTAGTLPMAATLATERVYSGFLGGRERMFLHGHTYSGNPLGARVALEVLSIFRDEAILEQAAAKALRIARAFERFATLPVVAKTRSLGMVGALDLRAHGGYFGRGGWTIYDAALERGAYLRPLGDVVYVAPPLNIADSDLDELLEITEASLIDTARVLLG